MVKVIAKEINFVTDWESIENNFSNIHSKVLSNSQNVDEKTFDVLILLCSPLAPNKSNEIDKKAAAEEK
jgi:hypothetical protein